MSNSLDEEIATYELNKAKLLAHDDGKFVLIKGTSIVDTFVDKDDAVNRGYTEFFGTAFLVKQIREVDIPLYFSSSSIIA